MRGRSLLLVAVCLLAGNLPAAVVVNEQFTDGDRTTQNTPDSMQWTYGAHHGTAASAFASLTVTNGAMVWDHTNGGNNSFSAIWAHFTPSGSPITVATGETLELSFDIMFSGGAFITNTNAFRFQLMNSNGSRVTTDFAGTNSTGITSGTTFNPWRGYEGTLPLSATTTTNGEFTVRERTNTANSDSLNTSTNVWAGFSGSAVTEPVFTAGQFYPGSLKLTRTATGMEIQASLAGVTTPLVTDTSSPFTSFDTVSFFTLDGLTHDITLDNVQVTVTPEPGVLSLVALGLATMLGRRRR